MSNHQHTLIIDGTSGISGDMTVAALLDLGASEEHLREQLATLPVGGFEIAVTRVNKHGIDACDFDVQLAEELENHDHDMAWLYGTKQLPSTHTSMSTTIMPMVSTSTAMGTRVTTTTTTTTTTRVTITPTTTITVLWRTSPPSSRLADE